VRARTALLDAPRHPAATAGHEDPFVERQPDAGVGRLDQRFGGHLSIGVRDHQTQRFLAAGVAIAVRRGAVVVHRFNTHRYRTAVPQMTVWPHTAAGAHAGSSTYTDVPQITVVPQMTVCPQT